MAGKREGKSEVDAPGKPEKARIRVAQDDLAGRVAGEFDGAAGGADGIDFALQEGIGCRQVQPDIDIAIVAGGVLLQGENHRLDALVLCEYPRQCKHVLLRQTRIRHQARG